MSYAEVYRTREWRFARWKAKQEAGHRCQGCGAAGRLEVHHRKRLSDGGEPYAAENLIVLCRRCHHDRHRHRKARTPGRDEWVEFVNA